MSEEIEKKNSNESFDNISDAMDTEFDKDEQTEEESQKKLEAFHNKRKSLMKRLDSQDSMLEDKNQIRFELMDLISNGQAVLSTLQEDIKIGSKPRSHEVYFNGLSKLVDAINSLRDLNKTDIDLKQTEKKINNKTDSNNLTVNYNLSGKELLKMMKEAEQNNSLNEIKAEFNVDDNSHEKDKMKKED